MFQKIKNENNRNIHPLPISKKQKTEFTPQMSKSIKKLLESYSQSDSANKELIAQYLQNIISLGKNMENRQNYLPIEPVSPANSSSIAHEKQSLALFENPKTKRICDDSINPLKSFNSLEQPQSNNSVKIPENNDNMMSSPFDNRQIVAFNKGVNSSMRNNSQPKISSASSIEHFNYDQTNHSNHNLSGLFKDSLYQAQSPINNNINNNLHHNINNSNNHNHNNHNAPLFSLSRANSANNGTFNNEKFDKLNMDNLLGQNMRYSPSPQRLTAHDLVHNSLSQNNIGEHPIHFPFYNNLNGSFTPDHTYGGDDEAYSIRSRRASFDNKNQESQSNNYPNIN